MAKYLSFDEVAPTAMLTPSNDETGGTKWGYCPNFSRHTRMPANTPCDVGALAASVWQDSKRHLSMGPSVLLGGGGGSGEVGSMRKPAPSKSSSVGFGATFGVVGCPQAATAQHATTTAKIRFMLTPFGSKGNSTCASRASRAAGYTIQNPVPMATRARNEKAQPVKVGLNR
jgi:hypothetical protein